MTSLLARWNELWVAAQVELHGHYSIQHLQEFETYRATTSWLRAVIVCVLTPLPCIVVVVLIDLLPLEPIAYGARGSPNVWARNFSTVFIIGVCVLEQFRTHLPQLELSRRLALFIAVVSASAGVGGIFLLSTVVGHPLPFAMVVGTVPWASTIVLLIYVYKRRQLRDCAGLPSKVWRYTLVFACQIAMTVVYPVYSHVYKKLSSVNQTAFVFLLPVIKIVAKNWISRTLPDTDDAKPEAVVFNVEIFHSLFVSLCMGNTTSSRTVVVLMAIDVAQAWLSFLDVHWILTDLGPVSSKLDNIRKRVESTGSKRRHGLQHLVELTNTIIDVEPFQARPGVRSRDHYYHQRKWSWLRANTRKLFTSLKSRRRSSAPPTAKLTQVLPSASVPAPPQVSDLQLAHHHHHPSPASIHVAPVPGKSLPSDVAALNVVERGVLVRQTQKVLFVTEFIVLIEYTEVIVPLIYVVCVVSMLHLPNAPYYPFLEGTTTMADLLPTISNVILYVTLEFASLLLMGVVMWWTIRLSLVHQLAFVLERRAGNVQTKLLLWVLDVMQNSVIQLGPDYSFRFEWLRHGAT